MDESEAYNTDSTYKVLRQVKQTYNEKIQNSGYSSCVPRGGGGAGAGIN